MKLRQLSLLLLAWLTAFDSVACPAMTPEPVLRVLLRPEQDFFIKSAQLLCDYDQIACSKQRLVIEGDFIAELHQNSVSLGLWLPEQANTEALPMRINWEKKPSYTIKVKQDPDAPSFVSKDEFNTGFYDKAFKKTEPSNKFRALHATIVIYESEKLPLSRFWHHMIGLALIDQSGEAKTTRLVVGANFQSFPQWEKTYPGQRDYIPCTKYDSYPTSIALTQPVLFPPVTPSFMARQKTTEDHLQDHRGEFLASQVSLAALFAFFFLVRRARSIRSIVASSLLGSVLITVFSFLLIGGLLPVYARDISMGSRVWSISSGFGWVCGSLLSLLVGVSFFYKATPSRDILERSLFFAGSLMIASLLGVIQWRGEVGWAFIFFVVASLFLVWGSFFISKRRVQWHSALQTGKLTGLEVSAKKEPVSEVLAPIFYHSDALAYDAVVFGVPSNEGPYRESQKALWLTCLGNPNELAPVRRRIGLSGLLGLCLLGVLGYFLIWY